MKSGVYKIENKINGKFYLGVTKDFKDRFRHHKSDLNLNKHHSIALQRAVNKYGIINFEFIPILYCPKEYLLKLENWCLKNLKPNYNTSTYSEYNNNISRSPLTEEHKNNISKSWTEERKKKLGKIVAERKTGTNLSKETKNKIGEANAKLTNDQVIEIRRLLLQKVKGKDIAKMFNISPQMVSQINKNKTYARIN